MIIIKSRLLAILISIHIDRCICIRIHLADVDGSLVYSTPSNPVRVILSITLFPSKVVLSTFTKNNKSSSKTIVV